MSLVFVSGLMSSEETLGQGMLPGLWREGLGALQAAPEAVVWQTPAVQPQIATFL